MNAIIARALVCASLIVAIFTIAVSMAEQGRSFTHFATAERIR